MGWLLKHEKGMLNSLIKQALKNGLAQEMEKVQFDSQGSGEASQELQTIILDFLGFLERSLAKNLDASHDAEHHPSSEQKIEPNDIRLRLQRAKQLLSKELSKRNTLEKNKKASSKKTKESKEEVLDQILKAWKPNKGDLVN